MPPDLRCCRKCGQSRVRSAFPRDKRNPDGLSYRCSECNRAKSEAWRKANPGRYHQYLRDWKDRPENRKACAERDKTYGPLWRAQNPERVRFQNAKKRIAVDYGVPYRLVPNDLASAKAAQLAVKRAIHEAKP